MTLAEKISTLRGDLCLGNDEKSKLAIQRAIDLSDEYSSIVPEEYILPLDEIGGYMEPVSKVYIPHKL